MTTQPHDNAFAGVTKDGYANGLSKREYFAAIAMQGLVAGYVNRQFNRNDDGEVIGITDEITGTDICAKLSVAAADALIEQLNKE